MYSVVVSLRHCCNSSRAKKREGRDCVYRLSSLLVRYEKLFLFDKRNKPKENYGANSGGNDLTDKLFAPLDT